MTTAGKLASILRTEDILASERLSIRLELDRLRRLEQVIHRTKRTPKQGSKPSKLATRPQTDLVINGVRVCHLCKRPIPHRAKTDHQYHMLAVKRRWMQQASYASWCKRGWEGFWQPGRALRYRNAIIRRTAMFREIAPNSAKLMSDAQIEAVINRCRPGKTRWLNNIQRWKTWVRRRYA